MEFPPLPEIPLEDEAVIPPRVIDELLDAPDEVVLASVTGVRGFRGGEGVIAYVLRVLPRSRETVDYDSDTWSKGLEGGVVTTGRID